MSTLREDIYTTLDNQRSDSGDYFADLRAAGYDTDAIDFDAVIDDSLDIGGVLSDFINADTNATRGAAKRIAGEILDADKADRRAALDALGFKGTKRRDLELDEIASAIEDTFADVVEATAATAASVSDLSQYEN